MTLEPVVVVESTRGAERLVDATVREHLRLPPAQDAGILGIYVPASLAYAERYTSRELAARAHTGETGDLDAFPAGLVVCTEVPTFTACTYTDADDVVQSVLESSFVSRYDRRRRRWALEYVGPEITSYKAGTPVALEWGAEVADPEGVDQARLMMISHFYENASAVVDGTVVEVPLGTHAILDVYADPPL